jgi:hypothetical protein
VWEDPIVEETRKARQEHAARFNHDLADICRDLKEQEAQGGRSVVVLEAKRPEDADKV